MSKNQSRLLHCLRVRHRERTETQTVFPDSILPVFIQPSDHMELWKQNIPVQPYHCGNPSSRGPVIVTDIHDRIVLNPAEPLQRNPFFCYPCHATQVVIPERREGRKDRRMERREGGKKAGWGGKKGGWGGKRERERETISRPWYK